MLRRLYDWTLTLAEHRHASAWLFLISFLESSFFPIPPHPLLGVMALARPRKAFWYGLVTTLGSVAGGLFGYLIGYFLFESVGIKLLGALHMLDSFPKTACYLRDYGAQLILFKGATPIPFKLVTISAGFIHLDLWTFIWATFVSRAIQFMLVGLLFWRFGTPIKAFLDKYLVPVSIAFVLLVVGGFFLAEQLTGAAAGTNNRCASATLESLIHQPVIAPATLPAGR